MNRTRLLIAAPPTVPVALMRRVAQSTLRSLRAPSGVFSIAFVDGPTMRGLNHRHLGHDYVTDVLSFDLRDDITAGRRRVLGEVIVAPGVARRQARRFGQTYRRELARYVIHGLLHWAGYDDQAPAQRRRMERKQESLLQQLMPEPA